MSVDTIEIGFNDKDTYDNMVGRLTTDGKNVINRIAKSGAYRNRISGRVGLISISLFSGNRFMTAEPYKLQIHLSSFSSYFEVIDFMTQFTGGRWETLLDARIYRLDLALNLPYSYGEISSKVTAPRTRVLQKFQSDSRSLVFGKGNRSLIIYEKYFRRWESDITDSEVVGDFEEIHGVRVELRLRGSMLPFKTFGELPKLVNLFPFDYLNVSNAKLDLNFESEANRVRSVAFELLSSEIGPKRAAKELGINENDLNTSDKNLLIHKAWINKVTRFFGISPRPENVKMATDGQ